MNRPGVESNDKYKCNRCGAIASFAPVQQLGGVNRCPVCHDIDWDQIVVVHVCDFCGTNETSDKWWRFPCLDFKHSMQVAGASLRASKGDWSACEVCKGLILEDDRRGLAQRAIDREGVPEGFDKSRRQFLFSIVRRGHDDFFDNWNGVPQEDTDVA